MANEQTNPNNEQNQNQNQSQKTDDKTALESRTKELEAEIAKLKQAVTNASADASKHKHEKEELQKQLDAKLTDEEKKKIEQDNANAALQKELNDLRNERNIAQFTAALTASDIGMDADNAKAVAEALNAGETDKVFDGIRKFIASHDKQMAEKALLNNPKLPSGNTTKTVTQDEFNKMGYKEMVAFKNEHPDLYKEYTK